MRIYTNLRLCALFHKTCNTCRKEGGKMAKATKQQLLDAINGSYGIISTIAKRLNVNWNTARTYIKQDDDATQAYNNERNSMLDKAESCIINALEQNDVSTAKWFLQLKGKDRGYMGTDADTLDDTLKFNFV